jgi:hypothetical protein
MNLQYIFRFGNVRDAADLLLPARCEQITVVSALPKIPFLSHSLAAVPHRIAKVTTRYNPMLIEKVLHLYLMTFIFTSLDSGFRCRRFATAAHCRKAPCVKVSERSATVRLRLRRWSRLSASLAYELDHYLLPLHNANSGPCFRHNTYEYAPSAQITSI